MKQNITASKQTQSEMEKVQKKFEDWRKNKTQREIPESLWEAAIQLHPEYSPYEIAKALRLHYSKLKRLILNACKKKTETTEKKIDSAPQKKTSNTLPEEKQSKMEKVCKKFEDWRANGTKRKMPEYLWKLAVELHPEYSICEISKVLQLPYNRLKNRVLETRKNGTEFIEEKKTEPPPAFIQWNIPGQPSQNEWTIEIENIDGAKMQISGKSSEPPDFISICQNFSRRNL